VRPRAGAPAVKGEVKLREAKATTLGIYISFIGIKYAVIVSREVAATTLGIVPARALIRPTQ
jgi:hypothetical protein